MFKICFEANNVVTLLYKIINHINTTDIMKTFKVTFFDNEMDIINVSTFHNVSDQSAFVDMLAVQIYTLDLHRCVKCEADGESYTKVVNYLIQQRIARLEA